MNLTNENRNTRVRLENVFIKNNNVRFSVTSVIFITQFLVTSGTSQK